jgi:hypothetical protein
LPESEPLLKVKFPALTPALVRRETLPVGTPDPLLGLTVPLTAMDWPCVRLLLGFRVIAVVLARNVAEDQFCSRLPTFTDPMPVARSYPVPVV